MFVGTSIVDPFEGEDSDPMVEGIEDEHYLEMAAAFKTLPNMLEIDHSFII